MQRTARGVMRDQNAICSKAVDKTALTFIEAGVSNPDLAINGLDSIRRERVGNSWVRESSVREVLKREIAGKDINFAVWSAIGCVQKELASSAGNGEPGVAG